MNLDWLDGKLVSILIDRDTNICGEWKFPIGMVMMNYDCTWTAFDCTKPNNLNTSSLPIGVFPDREDAKRTVYECLLSQRTAELLYSIMKPPD